jgi:hypothetical protein|tara:strand:- start:237 stop:818 length:582 start_codon:yes stop_codon:yes gene_type:complete
MSEIQVNTINEYTSANGVTIDGVSIKDGLVDGKDVSALSAGLTEYDQWNLTSNITTNTDPITSGFARPTGTLQTKLGTGMSHSSGIWTFPSTGIWQVGFHLKSLVNSDGEIADGHIYTTDDNGSNWDEVASGGTGEAGSGNGRGIGTIWVVIDVEDVSTDKVYFRASFNGSGEINGSSTTGVSWFWFKKLAET